jgi:L-ascorbate metabolism protein UlaG (beta-lactamase superfamily)
MRKLAAFLGKAILGLIIAFCLAITIIPRFLDRIYYEGPKSAHFDGTHFFNPDGDDTFRMPGRTSRGNFFIRWLTGQDDREVWPVAIAVTPSIPARTVNGDTMTATWIGHATVLVQADGLNILTDPIWANRSGPFGIGPKRVTAPGVTLKDLPKIDIILVSHNHYDHMDLDSIKAIWDRDHPLIVTSLGNDTLINGAGAKAVARDWGGRVNVKTGVDVIVTRNHHWDSRWMTDRNRALWSSFVVTLPGGNLFFAGDTGFGDGKWPLEAAAYGPIRLALLPIGAFRFQPGQMEIGSHMGPIQTQTVFKRLGASYAIPIHWGTFQLSNEARDTPPLMLAAVMKCAGYPDPSVFAAHRVGEGIAIPPYHPLPALKDIDPACLKQPAITGLR